MEGSESKLSTFSDGYKVISLLFGLFRDVKQLFFFSLITLVLLIIASMYFFPDVYKRQFPYYKLNDIAPTSEDKLFEAKKIANECGLEYVYIGNLECDTNTYCCLLYTSINNIF